jgi:hypothetical protein
MSSTFINSPWKYRQAADFTLSTIYGNDTATGLYAKLSTSLHVARFYLDAFVLAQKILKQYSGYPVIVTAREHAIGLDRPSM